MPCYRVSCAKNLHSYLITDYERSNFSISQCKFEDGLKEDLIAIPSTMKRTNHNFRNVTIGASIGAAFALLLGVFITWNIFHRRRRQSKEHEVALERSSIFKEPKEARVLTVCSVREIDDNSLCGPIRELPDSGKAELLDQKALSGSGNQISEMSASLKFVVHELRTHRSSKESSTVQVCPSAGHKIVESTKISRRSQIRSHSSDSSPCIETVISASTHGSSSDMQLSTPASTVVEGSPQASPPPLPRPMNLAINTTILEASSPKSLDLNRSLPPTPISESPQTSHSGRANNRDFPLHNNIYNAKAEACMLPSNPSLVKIPASKYSEAQSRCERGTSSVSPNSLEITIPPGSASTDTSGVSAISYEERVIDTTWL